LATWATSTKMNEEYSIRPVQECDLASLLDLVNQSIAESPANFHWQGRPLAEIHKEWVDASDTFPWLALVKEPTGLAVGLAKAGPFRSKQAYAWTAEVTIYLAESVQGFGQGKRLYGNLLEVMTDRGFHLAVGAITRPNPASEGLHGSLGFELIGVLPEVGWKTGAWHDVALWAKRLSDGGASPRLMPKG